MNKIDIVRKAIGFETPVTEQKALFDDEYQFTDSIGGPAMDKAAWFAMGDLYRAAMSNPGYAIDEIHQEGEDVILTGRFTGTFVHDFDLSAMHMGVIKATGKPVKFSPSTSRISFKGDKIVHNHELGTGPNAGLPGFLAAIKGVE
jgi:hypothetical protein